MRRRNSNILTFENDLLDSRNHLTVRYANESLWSFLFDFLSGGSA